jgi:hypothetical protein
MNQLHIHEDWLQLYIKEHFRQLGFASIHGPYSTGADLKGLYNGKMVRIEAEWDYTDYIHHQHSPDFADILIVANSKKVPYDLVDRLPAIIFHVSRQKVIEWAKPRIETKTLDDYHSFAWWRLSRSLLILYGNYQRIQARTPSFPGAYLLPLPPSQTPPGFVFAPGGRETGFKGSPQDKNTWDRWLALSHYIAEKFGLKPALLRPTWIDRVALHFDHTGHLYGSDQLRLQEVMVYLDSLIQNQVL